MYMLSGPNTEPFLIITNDGEVVIRDEARAAEHAPELLALARKQDEYKAVLAEIEEEIRGKDNIGPADAARLTKIEGLIKGGRNAGGSDNSGSSGA